MPSLVAFLNARPICGRTGLNLLAFELGSPQPLEVDGLRGPSSAI